MTAFTQLMKFTSGPFTSHISLQYISLSRYNLTLLDISAYTCTLNVKILLDEKYVKVKCLLVTMESPIIMYITGEHTIGDLINYHNAHDGGVTYRDNTYI